MPVRVGGTLLLDLRCVHLRAIPIKDVKPLKCPHRRNPPVFDFGNPNRNHV